MGSAASSASNSGEWFTAAVRQSFDAGVTPRNTNNPGTFCANFEKSSEAVDAGVSKTFFAPAARSSVGSMRAVRATSFVVTG